jgi:hypothetical protein
LVAFWKSKSNLRKTMKKQVKKKDYEKFSGFAYKNTFMLKKK